MASQDDAGYLLVAPHQFPDLDREKALADELGLKVVAAANQEAFSAGMPDAAVVMVTPYGQVRRKDFESMKHCRAVVRYGIGYDNIDVEAADDYDVPVSIVPAASTEEVASHALALGLALARRIPQGQHAIRSGSWAGQVGFDAPRLTDLDVGILGMGRIGGIAAAGWSALGAKVRAYDPFATFSQVPSAPLDEILVDSDVLSLHLPLTSDTRNLISKDVLDRMRPGAVIVNVSRGGLIDEEALAAALVSGHIAGAGLDTFGQEPLAADHPLRDVPTAVLTPHVAWRSNKSLEALQSAAVDRARRSLLGEPIPDLVTKA